MTPADEYCRCASGRLQVKGRTLLTQLHYASVQGLPAVPAAGPPLLLASPVQHCAPAASLPPLQERSGDPAAAGSAEQLPCMKQEQQEGVVAALFGLSQPTSIAT